MVGLALVILSTSLLSEGFATDRNAAQRPQAAGPGATDQNHSNLGEATFILGEGAFLDDALDHEEWSVSPTVDDPDHQDLYSPAADALPEEWSVSPTVDNPNHQDLNSPAADALTEEWSVSPTVDNPDHADLNPPAAEALTGEEPSPLDGVNLDNSRSDDEENFEARGRKALDHLEEIMLDNSDSDGVLDVDEMARIYGITLHGSDSADEPEDESGPEQEKEEDSTPPEPDTYHYDVLVPFGGIDSSGSEEEDEPAQ
jgi:hypothetical protein